MGGGASSLTREWRDTLVPRPQMPRQHHQLIHGPGQFLRLPPGLPPSSEAPHPSKVH